MINPVGMVATSPGYVGDNVQVILNPLLQWWETKVKNFFYNFFITFLLTKRIAFFIMGVNQKGVKMNLKKLLKAESGPNPAARLAVKLGVSEQYIRMLVAGKVKAGWRLQRDIDELYNGTILRHSSG